MRFGFVARVTLAFALLVLFVFGLKVFYYQESAYVEPGIVKKQPITKDSRLPDFAAISDVREKKRAFFAFIRPGVSSANRQIALKRQFLLDIALQISQQSLSFDELSPGEIARIQGIAREFKIRQSVNTPALLNKLLSRVDIIPNELVMVQAANESGWGTSRFARLGLNFFGQWCFTKGCGLVPAARNEEASHEVEVFDSVDASIASYLRNLNTHAAYAHLRAIRADLRRNNLEVKAEHLAPGLLNYSQRQQDYVIELLQMLNHNKAYL